MSGLFGFLSKHELNHHFGEQFSVARAPRIENICNVSLGYNRRDVRIIGMFSVCDRSLDQNYGGLVGQLQARSPGLRFLSSPDIYIAISYKASKAVVYVASLSIAVPSHRRP